jgi:hypothetical protein
MPKNSRSSMKNSPFEDLPEDQQFERFDSTVVDRIMSLREEFDSTKPKDIIGKFNEPMGKLDKQPTTNVFSNRLYDETITTQNQIVSDLGKTTSTEEPKKKKKKNRNMLLILDDITAYLKDDPHLLIELTTNRRHLKLSICLLVQFLRSIPKPVRFQITDITLFKPGNELDAKIIEEEFSGMKPETFKALKMAVWKNKHDFLFISKDTESYYKNLQKIHFKQINDIESIDNIDAENKEDKENHKKKTHTKTNRLILM